MLNPWWGRPEGIHLAWPRFADRYVQRAPTLFELTTLEECDVAVFPQDWKVGLLRTPETLLQRARAFADEARAAGKPFLFFRDGDAVDPVPIEGAIVLRQSLERSTRGAREHCYPSFFEDLTEYTGGELRVREYATRPVVGFCGVAVAAEPPRGAVAAARRAAAGVKRRVHERLGKPDPQDVFVRSRALEALRRQSAVETNVVVREAWGGGAFFPDFDPELWARVRQEYVDNLVGSDYGLCARGIGNFSIRLYETLCLGRIPVVIDTAGGLPFESHLDWDDYCVWIDRTEIRRIGEKVAEHHRRLGPAGFVEKQRACRRLWEEYLTPEGFFSHLHLVLEASE